MSKVLEFPTHEKALQKQFEGKTLADVYAVYGYHIWDMEQTIGSSAHYTLYNNHFDPDEKECLDIIERFAVYNRSIQTEKGEGWVVDSQYIYRLYDALRAQKDYQESRRAS